MFEFLETGSRRERAGLLALISMAAFVPIALILSIALASANFDPKFGFGGSAAALFYLLSVPFVGFLLGLATCALLGISGPERMHVYLAAFFPVIALGIVRAVVSFSIGVKTSLVAAASVGFVIAIIIEFFAAKVAVSK
jgi:hypothetical protein